MSHTDTIPTVPTLPAFPGWAVKGYVLKGYEADPEIGLPARADKVVFNAHKGKDETFTLGSDLMDTMRFIVRNSYGTGEAAKIAQAVITYVLGA